ncbi:hypothetical protein FJR06_06705 [Dolichospermum sp. UHCC 0352]|jgi:hypothetical protein|uniref:hypothetical protein n=1 Tax=Dolichospermum sp. UHCC 0352 TaxID=2590011 RepID=UPI001444B3FA|nr:hypothetical protein [Dolichospermum sp. UHCC 0352]MTJ21031.1 hypothetical protein [Dolichospermum sp. UHCC 0352]
MINFIHVFGLTLFTLIFKYIFLKDFYFYLDDFSVFSDFEETNSIVPIFTDRPLAGIFLISIFQVFKWNAIYYHIFGAILEIIANLTVYHVCDRLIWNNKFYSSLTVLFFLLIPGHSQEYWWVILLTLKLLLVVWLGSIYFFYQFLLTKKNKFLLISSLLYGTTLFCYELALFLPIIHCLLYARFVIWKEPKINFLKLLKTFSYFGAYIFAFLLFRFTKSFGLSSQFDRSHITIENIFIRTKDILQSTFWLYPQMDNYVGSQAFKGSRFTEFSFIIISLFMIFLIITWFYPIFKSSNTANLFRKNDYIFTIILSICLCLYPLIPFFLTSAWFDTRHTYLPHLGLAVIIVLILRGFLEIIQKIKHKKIEYAIILIIFCFLVQPLTSGAESMIGLGTIWRHVGLDLKNYEAIVKSNFPTVPPQTLFLIKDAEILRNWVPVFAGDWVVNGFFRKIYPIQAVKGDYYNILAEEHQYNLKFKINPDFNSLIVAQKKYNFEQIIILDGKNQLRPFSAINIKTLKGNYLKKLQTSDNSDNLSSVLELYIP